MVCSHFRQCLGANDSEPKAECVYSHVLLKKKVETAWVLFDNVKWLKDNKKHAIEISQNVSGGLEL